MSWRGAPDPPARRGSAGDPPRCGRAPGQLAAGRLALADHRPDRGVVVGEDVVQQEGRALRRRQALQQGEESERERLGQLGARGRVSVIVRLERLRQPRPGVCRAPHPLAAQVIEAEAGHHRREEVLRRAHRVSLAVYGDRLPAQEGLLDHGLGVRDAAEHAVGEREEGRPVPLERRDGRARRRRTVRILGRHHPCHGAPAPSTGPPRRRLGTARPSSPPAMSPQRRSTIAGTRGDMANPPAGVPPQSAQRRAHLMGHRLVSGTARRVHGGRVRGEGRAARGARPRRAIWRGRLSSRPPGRELSRRDAVVPCATLRGVRATGRR